MDSKSHLIDVFFMFLINSRENDENMNNKKMILNSHSETDTEKKGKKVIDFWD